MIKAIQAKPGTGMSLSPPPAPTNPSESVAAPTEVGQGAGTQHDDLCECKFCVCTPEALKRSKQAALTLEQFQRWLENVAHKQTHALDALPAEYEFLDDVHLRREEHELCILEARVSTKLLMQFKLEQSA